MKIEENSSIKSKIKCSEINGSKSSLGKLVWWSVGVILGFSICIIIANLLQIIPENGPNLTSESEQCSGRGVWLAESQECLCDLNWKPPSCSIEIRMPQAALTAEKRVLFITDKFGGLASSKTQEWDEVNFDSTAGAVLENLAVQLSNWGRGNVTIPSSLHEHAETLQATFSITVLYTGEPITGDSLILAREYFAKKSANLEFVSLQRVKALTDPGLSDIDTSYSVYEFLKQRPSEFDVVYVSASKGHGFHALRAKSQGLLDQPPEFVVSVDDLPASVKTKLKHGHIDFVPSDVAILKSDYIADVCLELADKAVFPSRYMYDISSHRYVQMPIDSRIIPPPSLLAPKALVLGSKTSARAEAFRGKQIRAKVKEIVFLGNALDRISGLQIFAEALSMVQHKLAKSATTLKVTFIGGESPFATLENQSSDDYLQFKSLEWDGIEWEVYSGRLDWNDTLQFLRGDTRKSPAQPSKLVVMPGLVETTAFLLQELLYAGLPVIASDLPANRAVISALDRNQVLFPSNNSAALSAKLYDALKNGTLVPRPFLEFSDSLESFVRLFSVSKNHTASHLGPVFGSVDVEMTEAMYGVPNSNDLGGMRSDSHREAPEALPSVTVVLVHRNRPQLLKQAIESLEKQSFTNFEVVLVDDGSDTDEAMMLLSELAWHWWETRQWKVVRSSQVYLGAARNLGVQHAKGDWIVFMDDDDVAKQNQIEVLVKVALKTRSSIVTAGHDTFTGLGWPTSNSFMSRYVPLGPSRKVGMRENCFGDSAFMVHKTVFIELGGFTEMQQVGFEDYEFLARAVLEGVLIESVPEALHWYRLQQSSMSSTTDLKENQNRALRPYFIKASHNVLSKDELALLGETKQRFFERDSPVPDYYVDTSNENRTIPIPDPVACPHPTMIWVEECNKCYYVAPELDCAGICPGNETYGSHIDCAGNCLKPNVAATIVLDSCGVCGGNNSSCTDCKGVLNGTAMPDSCGVCNGNGGTCLALTGMYPTAIPNTGTNTITLLGAGFTVSSTIFFANNLPVPLRNIRILANNYTYAQIVIETVFDLNNQSYIYIPIYARNLAKASQTLTLTVYNSDAAILNLVSDKAYVRNATQTAQIVVHHAVKTATPTSFCLFRFLTYNNETTSPLTYVNDTLVTCPIPKLYLSQGAQLFIYYGNNSNPLYYVPAILGYPFSYTSDSLLVKYYEPQPLPLSVVMDNFGERIHIRFNKRTDALIGPSPCVDYFSTMLDDPTVSILQNSSIFDCNATWINAELVVVSSLYSFRLDMPTLFPQPGLYIKFKPSTIKSLGAEYSDYTTGRVLIRPPHNPIVPTVGVSAPASFSSDCFPQFTVDLGTTLGAAGALFIDADFTFRDLNYSSLHPNFDLDYALVNASIDVVETGVMVYNFPTDVFQVNHEYLLNFELTNFLGQTSLTSIKVQRTNDTSELHLRINAPQYVHVGDTFAAGAYFELGPLCTSSALTNNMSVTWTMFSLLSSMKLPVTSTSDDYDPAYLDTEADLSAFVDSWNVQLPPYTLKTNTSYVIIASVITINGTLNAQARFSTSQDSVSLYIVGGNSWQQSQSQDIILQTVLEGSSHPHLLIWSWSCITPGGFGCMVPGTGPAEGTFSQLTGPSASQWTISGNLLPLGEYIFSSAAFDPLQNMSFGTLPTLVKLDNGYIYHDSASWTSNGRLKVRQLQNIDTTAGTLAVEAYVDSTNGILFGVDANSLLYYWSSPENCLMDSATFPGLVWSISDQLTAYNYKRLYINSSEPLLGGSFYCVHVDAYTSGGANLLGSAELILEAIEPPTLGECTVNNGTSSTITLEAFQDIVLIQCFGQTFVSGKVLYRYTYVPLAVDGTPQFNLKTSSGPPTAKATFETVFGPGDTRLYIDVFGVSGNDGQLVPAASSIVFDFTAVSSSPVNFALLWNSSISRFNATRSFGDLFQDVALYSPYVNPTSSYEFRRRHKRSTDAADSGWDTINLEMVEAITSIMTSMSLVDPYKLVPVFAEVSHVLVGNTAFYSKFQPYLANFLFQQIHVLTESVGGINWLWTKATSSDSLEYIFSLSELWLQLVSGADYAATKQMALFQNRIAASIALGQICGQYATNFTGSSGILGLSVGVYDRVSNELALTDRTICPLFSVESLSDAAVSGFNSSQDCFQYICGSSSVNYLTGATNSSLGSFQAVDSSLYTYELSEYDTGVPNISYNELSLSANFKFTMALSSDLIGKIKSTLSWQSLVVCAFYTYTGGYSQTDCQPTDFNGTHVDCLCKHLTEFVPAISQSTLPNLSKKSLPNIGLIVGIVLGAFGFAMLAAMAIVAYKRRNRKLMKQKRAQVGTDVNALPELTSMDEKLNMLDNLALAASGIGVVAPTLPLDNIVPSRLTKLGVTLPAERQRLQKLAHIMYEQEANEVSSLVDLDNEPVPDYEEDSAAAVLGLEQDVVRDAFVNDRIEISNRTSKVSPE